MNLPKVLWLYSFQPWDKVFINSHSTFNLNTNYVALHLHHGKGTSAQNFFYCSRSSCRRQFYIIEARRTEKGTYRSVTILNVDPEHDQSLGHRNRSGGQASLKASWGCHREITPTKFRATIHEDQVKYFLDHLALIWFLRFPGAEEEVHVHEAFLDDAGYDALDGGNEQSCQDNHVIASYLHRHIRFGGDWALLRGFPCSSEGMGCMGDTGKAWRREYNASFLGLS